MPDQLWGIDATSTLTTEQGNVNVFVVVDHCTAECLALVASKRGTRFEAIDALRNGIHAVFGGYEPGIGGGLSMRHDHGSPFVAELFQRELDFLGITSSPAYVREPEGNGCAERFIRTLKEQLLWRSGPLPASVSCKTPSTPSGTVTTTPGASRSTATSAPPNVDSTYSLPPVRPPE